MAIYMMLVFFFTQVLLTVAFELEACGRLHGQTTGQFADVRQTIAGASGGSQKGARCSIRPFLARHTTSFVGIIHDYLCPVAACPLPLLDAVDVGMVRSQTEALAITYPYPPAAAMASAGDSV